MYYDDKDSNTVHPHGCGEHIAVTGFSNSLNGSSPRMWGTQSKQYQNQILLRFIPTDVGNTESDIIAFVSGAVHPHGCGEHGNRLVIYI